MAVSLDEARIDLANTQRDLACLTVICENLRTFVYQSGGEDRRAFRVDLMKYEGLEREARGLEQKIRAYAEGLAAPFSGPGGERE